MYNCVSYNFCNKLTCIEKERNKDEPVNAFQKLWKTSIKQRSKPTDADFKMGWNYPCQNKDDIIFSSSFPTLSLYSFVLMILSPCLKEPFFLVIYMPNHVPIHQNLSDLLMRGIRIFLNISLHNKFPVPSIIPMGRWTCRTYQTIV